MSAFTKPPNDASNAPAPKNEAQPAKPAVPQKPPGPPVIVTRTIDVGPAAPAGKSRPAAPTVNVGVQMPPKLPPTQSHVPAPPPAAAVAPAAPGPPGTIATPPTPKTPTLKMDTAAGVRTPEAPTMVMDEGITSIADTFERMLASDLDKGFEAIERKPGAPATIEGMEITDLGEVRDLFAQLATDHVRPVRDFLIDLRWGEATDRLD